MSLLYQLRPVPTPYQGDGNGLGWELSAGRRDSIGDRKMAVTVEATEFTHDQTADYLRKLADHIESRRLVPSELLGSQAHGGYEVRIAKIGGQVEANVFRDGIRQDVGRVLMDAAKFEDYRKTVGSSPTAIMYKLAMDKIKNPQPGPPIDVTI